MIDVVLFSGVEYPAVVEFAPFQRVPKNRLFQKQDPREGTIESCDYYSNFLNNLILLPKPSKQADRQVLDLQVKAISGHRDFGNLTPLLRYIYEKRSNRGKKQTRTPQWGENCMVFINSTKKKKGGFKKTYF